MTRAGGLWCWVFVLISFPCVGHAEVYKWVDNSGAVHYSDRPHPGAEVMKNLEIPVYLSPPPRGPVLAKSEPKTKPNSGYKSVEITSPRHDEGIRSNNGDFVVSVAVAPELDAGLGHRLGMLLDGALVGEPGVSDQFQLANVERGSHTLQAVVFEPGGEPLAQSAPITVHLQRQSTFRPGTKPGEQNFNPAGRFRPAENFPAPNFPAPNYPFEGPGVTEPR